MAARRNALVRIILAWALVGLANHITCGQTSVGHFPINRANRSAVYRPFVDANFLVGGSTDRGESDLFLPLIADDQNLLFADSRGSLGDTGFQEGNWAIAFRRITDGGKIIGVWAGYDLRRTQWGHRFHQVAMGLEWLDEEWDFRLNGYIPTNLTPTDTPLSAGELVIGSNIQIASNRELALWGLDVELGRRLWHRPAFAKHNPGRRSTLSHRRHGLVGAIARLSRVEADWRCFVGGYYFDNSANGADSVTGPRIRSELRLYDLERFGSGSRLTFEGIFHKDSLRGPEFEVGTHLRIPFGARPRRHSTPLERRMTDRIVRDRDIVTSVGTVKESVEVADSGLKVDRVVYFDSTTSDVSQTIRDAGPDSLVIIENANEPFIEHSQTIELQPRQVVVGSGAKVPLRGVDTGLIRNLEIPGRRPTLKSAGITAVRATERSQLIGLDFWLDRPTEVGIEAIQNAELRLDDVNIVHKMDEAYSILLGARDQARVFINRSVFDTQYFYGLGIRLDDDAQVFMDDSSLLISGGAASGTIPEVFGFAAAYGNSRLSIANTDINLPHSGQTWFRFFDNSQLIFDHVEMKGTNSPVLELRGSSSLIARDWTYLGENVTENHLLDAFDQTRIRILDSYLDVPNLRPAMTFQDQARVLFRNSTIVGGTSFAPTLTAEDDVLFRFLDSVYRSRFKTTMLTLSDNANAVIDGSILSTLASNNDNANIQASGNNRILVRNSRANLFLAGSSRSYVEKSLVTLVANDDTVSNIVDSDIPTIFGHDNAEIRVENSLVGFANINSPEALSASLGMDGNSRLIIDDSLVHLSESYAIGLADQSQTTIRNSTIDQNSFKLRDDASLTYENVKQNGGLVFVGGRGFFHMESSEFSGTLSMSSSGPINRDPIIDIVDSRITSNDLRPAIQLDGGQLVLRNSDVVAYSTDSDAIHTIGNASVFIDNSNIENHSTGFALSINSIGYERTLITVTNTSLKSEQGLGIHLRSLENDRFQIRNSDITAHGTAISIQLTGNGRSGPPSSVVLDENRLVSYNSSVPEIDVLSDFLKEGSCLSISNNVFGRGPGTIRIENRDPLTPLLIEQSRPSNNVSQTNALNRVNGIPAENVIFDDNELTFDAHCPD